jgi:hypothetical protein
MKLSINRTTTIAMILLLTISAFAMAVSTVEAHYPPMEWTTHAYVTLSPVTAGVGQTVQAVMWLDWVPPTAGGEGGDRWRDLTLTVTKPDGTSVELGPFTTSPVGSTYTSYTPDQTGTYTFVLNFPGQVLTNGTGTPNFRGAAYVNDTFLPSTSDPATLPVTASPVPEWVEPDLPIGFWSRPINDANRGWSVLASNWLKGSWLVDDFQRAGRAPTTPHIVWQRSITAGGIGDAQWPGQPYDINDYESPWTDPIVMNGVIYYNTPQTASNARYGYYAVDLLTGEQLWYKNGTDNGLDNPVRYVGYASGANQAPELHQTFPTLSFGQMMHYSSLNGQGVISYLWMTVGSTWYMLDSDNGNWIMSLVHVPGGTSATDQNGALLRYSYNSNTGKLLCWNSTQSIPPSGPTGTAQQIWKPRVGAVIDAVNDTSWTEVGPRYSTYAQYNVTYPQWTESDILPRSGYTMNLTIDTGLAPLRAVLQDANRVPKMLLGFEIDPPIATGGLSEPTQTISMWSARIDEHVAPYSPYPDKSETQNTNLGFGVTLLWNKNITNPIPGTAIGLGALSYEDGIFTLDSKEAINRVGYSLETGEQIWGPTPTLEAWNVYGQSDNVAYGKIFVTGYSGVLHALDAKTGMEVWNYTASSIGSESPYGNYPLSIGAIADGKIYLYSTEHSPTKPLWRGSYIRCLDVNNGQELWKLLVYNMGMAVADGYIVAGDQYDNNMLVIGKGQTATTVSTQTFAAPKGTPVLIQGTVTDQSPGAPGSPAISDANMQAWMEYLYKQQAAPSDAVGVPVHLTAVDSSGSTTDIGTVVSDVGGMYKKGWTPPAEGEYTIVATFDGSNAYFGSCAETALLVGGGAAPVVSPSPTSAVSPPGSGTPMTTYIAIIAAVLIVVAVAAALILRRRR